VLISLFRLHGEKGPHWLTLTGYDGDVFRVLDPMSPPREGHRPDISIAREEFERMSRYGGQRQGAAVVLSAQSATVR
jgi:Peptidase_C39 like family